MLTREQLIALCIAARAELEGVKIDQVNAEVFKKMTNEELASEFGWLQNILDK